MSDKQQLLDLHRAAMGAHWNNDVELMLQDDAEDDYVMSGRGVVSWPTISERRQRLGDYLNATTFEVYQDEITPIVKVSADGTLGWVICQVYVKGEQPNVGGHVEFRSSWIELYEKRNGQWLRIGNVSNILPIQPVV